MQDFYVFCYTIPIISNPSTFINPMKQFITRILTSSRNILSTLFIILMSGALIASAALAPLTPPPAGGYDVGTNSILDPGCNPGDINCFVKNPLPTGGSAGQSLTTNGSGVYSWANPSASSVPATGVTGAADVTTASSKITLSGTPTGAVLKAFTVDVNEGNLSLQNIGGALSTTQLGALNIANIGGSLSGAQQNAINFANLAGSVNLTSQVSGVLPIANGGTGASTAAGALTNLLPTGSTANQVLTSTGSGFTWNTASSLITAQNGLSKLGTGEIELGGNLTKNTTINAGTNSFILGATDGTNSTQNTVSVGSFSSYVTNGVDETSMGVDIGNAFLRSSDGTYNNELQLSSRNLSVSAYTDTRNDILAYTPKNFLYTDNKGNFLSTSIDNIFQGDIDYTGGSFVGKKTGTYSGYNLKTPSGNIVVLGENLYIGMTDNSTGTSFTTSYDSLEQFKQELNATISSIGNSTVFEITADSTGQITLYAPAGIQNGLQLVVRNDNIGDWYNAANNNDPESDREGEIAYTVSVNLGYKNIKVTTDTFNTATDKVFFYRPGGGGTTLTGDYFGWSNPETVQWSNIPTFNSALNWDLWINIDTDGLGSSTFTTSTASYATFADLVAALNVHLAAYGSSFRLVAVGGDRIFVTNLAGNPLLDGDAYFATNSFNTIDIEIMDNGGSGFLVKGTSPKKLTVSGVSTGTGTGGMYYGTLPSSGSSLQWYAEYTTAGPVVPPQAKGVGSIAFGDGAKANADNMFVWGNGAGAGIIGFSKPPSSVFMGTSAGTGATNAYGSNFFGQSAGQDAINANSSNFFGISAGQDAINASSSNFFGISAGKGATDANQSNFVGSFAGQDATNAHDSNFFSQYAGENATYAYMSNFFGQNAGRNATHATHSVFIGNMAGENVATNSTYSGVDCIAGSNKCFNSIFIGQQAGQDAISANSSNFFGLKAGQSAINANRSNFFGESAGQGATSASSSNFIGYSAGNGATNAFNSNFIGENAGNAATFANNSNFFGASAGNAATFASNSNFIGNSAGNAATAVTYSNFIGYSAGNGATNAANSNFIGNNAGSVSTLSSTGSINSANSIFIGLNSGALAGDFTLDNVSVPGTSILIGDNTSTGGFSNSIAIGAGATNTAVNQFMIGSAVSPINDLVITGAGFTTCSVNTGTGVGISCSSDERLKTNIADISNTDALKNLANIKTVSYNWKASPTGKQMIGFLAQDLQKYYPQVVSESSNGYLQVNYAGMVPAVVAAIKELNLKVDTAVLATGNTTGSGFFDALKNWLGGATNGLEKLFAREVHTDKLCVGQTCLDENQIKQILQSQGVSGYTTSNTNTSSTDGSNSGTDSSAPGTDTTTGGDNTGGSTGTDTTDTAGSGISTTDTSAVSDSSTPVVETQSLSETPSDTVTTQ